MANRKANTTIHSEAREIIANIIEKCDEERVQKHLRIPLNKSTERAAEYTGVGYSTIKKIRKEHKIRKENSPDRLLKSPGKKRRIISRNILHVDDFDKCVIRNTIQDFYIQEKRVPTIPKLLTVIKEKINFPWGRKSLNRVVKSMGFRWRKCQSKRKILVERPDIIDWRANYLRKMKKYREEGREIVYVDETWVDSNLTHRRCWQSDDVMGVQDNMNSGNRLIILHAGGASGFLAGAELIYKAGSTTGDYHGQMNSGNFQKWVVNQLMPNLQPNSVVVLDNAPYHCIQVDKAPSPYALKGDMIEWLRKKGVECNETMRKNDLYKLILPLKPKEKTYRIDNMLSGSGHVVIRLPPYMCDLNAIELAWSKIKRIVRDTNVTGDLSLTKLRETTKNAIQEVTRQDWAGFCHHVANLEAEYWEKDGVVPDVIDQISINLNTDSDSEAGGSDSENGSSSSEESV